MNKEDISQVVKQNLAQGRIGESLKVLNKYVKGNDRYLENDILLQSAAYNRNKNDYHHSRLTAEQNKISIAKISDAILYILEKLPDQGNNVLVADASTKESAGIAGKTKILFLSANPKNTGILRVDEEYRKVKGQLSAAKFRDRYDLFIETAVKISTITGSMQRVKPSIVHLSGHGSGLKGIAVEDDFGNAVLFPTSGINRLFKMYKDEVSCVLLNACYSKAQALEISKHGIHVVGMNNAISDQAAIEFSSGFYQSIGEGNDYDFAYEMAMVNCSPFLNDANIPELWYNGEIINS